ncbi:hypothetical protein LTR36_008922 [Oleoguttula mirabilis]|uniref:Uncharacterized protein n=1 Tax=Oleoguttula mirabilis TaxID=1507867 RepID=A0AAV9J8I8_9PEZI|nr:hypothetical protein LTR36_008922 [Oleoguttula mirabilis]
MLAARWSSNDQAKYDNTASSLCAVTSGRSFESDHEENRQLLQEVTAHLEENRVRVEAIEKRDVNVLKSFVAERKEIIARDEETQKRCISAEAQTDEKLCKSTLLRGRVLKAVYDTASQYLDYSPLQVDLPLDLRFSLALKMAMGCQSHLTEHEQAHCTLRDTLFQSPSDQSQPDTTTQHPISGLLSKASASMKVEERAALIEQYIDQEKMLSVAREAQRGRETTLLAEAARLLDDKGVLTARLTEEALTQLAGRLAKASQGSAVSTELSMMAGRDKEERLGKEADFRRLQTEMIQRLAVYLVAFPARNAGNFANAYKRTEGKLYGEAERTLHQDLPRGS